MRKRKTGGEIGGSIESNTYISPFLDPRILAECHRRVQQRQPMEIFYSCAFQDGNLSYNLIMSLLFVYYVYNPNFRAVKTNLKDEEGWQVHSQTKKNHSFIRTGIFSSIKPPPSMNTWMQWPREPHQKYLIVTE